MRDTKVLLVDDDPLLVSEMGQLLRGHGYNVIKAANGVEAIKMMIRERPDVVVTDIILPESDGIEVVRRAREILPEAKIIAMSGGGRVRTRDLLQIAEGRGAEIALFKPFSAVVLLRAIEATFRVTTPERPENDVRKAATLH